MPTTSQAAETIRILSGRPSGDPDFAVAAQGLISAGNKRVLLADDLLKVGTFLPFVATATVVKAVKATGSVTFSGLPTDGQTITIGDGVNPAKVFEADRGTQATGTITLNGVPADHDVVTIDNDIYEFNKGVEGVASAGGEVTFTGVGVEGELLTLVSPSGMSFYFEFNTGGGVNEEQATPVFCGTNATTAAQEMANAINASGYASNGSETEFVADILGGVLTIIRLSTGASNQTITGSGVNWSVTSNFTGGVDEVTPGSDLTTGTIGIATSATPGGSLLSTATVLAGLITEIGSSGSGNYTATQGAGTTATVTATLFGTSGNSIVFTESASNLTVTGAGTLTGGAAAGSGAVTGSNVPFAIGATAALTATALHNAIAGASSFDVTSANAVAGTVTLTNDLAGTAGNIAIVETLGNATTIGMTGGTDDITTALLPDTHVPEDAIVWLNGFTLKVDGATAWNEAASLKIEDTAGVDLVTVLKAALTNAAVLHPHSSNVTLDAAWYTGGTAGKGLKITLSGNEQTGSNVVVKVNGVIQIAADTAT